MFRAAGCPAGHENTWKHHVRGELAPRLGDFAIALLENDFAVLARNARGAQLPLDGFKGVLPGCGESGA
jgi:hypothetical protein